MEKHTVSRLFGSPPGYVGYEEGGQLTEKVRRKPFSVVLFDEIEKAHPDVFNTLLQILEDGRLTDAQGRVVDFKNTVIIMTTNLGTKDISKGVSVGFASASESRGTYERMTNRVQDELKQHFRPEFLNRVDDTIVFHQLTKEEIFQIVDLMIAKVEERLKDRDMGIELKPMPRTCSPSAATTQYSVPGRFAGRSSARSRIICRRRSCSARSRPARSSWSTPRAPARKPSSPSRACRSPRSCPTRLRPSWPKPRAALAARWWIVVRRDAAPEVGSLKALRSRS